MKIICKNMKREELAVDLDPSEKLESLLKKLEEVHGIDAEQSSLIFSGTIISEADLTKTIESLNYKEGDWFVLFPRKLKMQKQTQEQTQKQTVPTPTPTPARAMTNSSNPSGRGGRLLPLPPRMAVSRAPIVRISEEAISSLMAILQSDPNCSQLLRNNPALIARIRDPVVLINLANLVGLDLTRFIRRSDDPESNNESRESHISDSIWPSPSPFTVPQLPSATSTQAHVSEASETPEVSEAPEVSERQRRQILRLPEAEVKLLMKIKADLMDILGELPETVNEYQVNTMVYECYLAADKDPEVALNILIDHLLDQGD